MAAHTGISPHPRSGPPTEEQLALCHSNSGREGVKTTRRRLYLDGSIFGIFFVDFDVTALFAHTCLSLKILVSAVNAISLSHNILSSVSNAGGTALVLLGIIILCPT